MTISRRRLPHVYPAGKWLFVTWHLHGSLPHGRYPPPDKASAGRAFVWIDRYLDLATNGPLFLKRPELANLVVESLRKGVVLGHYEFGAFAVMAQSCSRVSAAADCAEPVVAIVERLHGPGSKSFSGPYRHAVLAGGVL